MISILNSNNISEYLEVSDRDDSLPILKRVKIEKDRI